MNPFAFLQTAADVDALEFITDLLERGGPEPHEYAELNGLIDDLAATVAKSKNPEAETVALRGAFGDDFLLSTIHGHCLRRPYGYAGDFSIIDKIYTYHVTSNPQYRRWDEFFHTLSAPKAVRNRKRYFKQTLNRWIGESQKPEVRLLNVASGPARDLAELYGQIDPVRLATTCVEMDANAIRHARVLTAPHASRISFIEKNIFRFETDEKFDVIWSAGLFDYFDDKTFVAVLRRMKTWLAEGGEIVIGNFSPNNPNRQYMELFGNWFLHHRTDEQLAWLATEAGFSPETIFVGQEAEGVNLFVHLRA